MSETKKGTRIVGVPNVPLTQRGYVTVDRMDDVYGAGVGGAAISPNDPLVQLEREETSQALKDLRELQLKKKTRELQSRIEKEKAELEGGAGQLKGIYNFTAADIAAISKMGDQEKQQFFQTVQMINSMAIMQPQVGGQNPLLAMAMAGGFGGGRQQGLTAKDVLDIGSQYANLFQGAGRGDSELSKSLLMNLLTTTLPNLQNSANTNMQMAYQMQIAELQKNQADPLRDLEYLKKGAEAMGYKPMSENIELGKLRLDMEDRWKVKEFDLKLNELNYSRQLGIVREALNNPLVDQLFRGIGRNIAGGGTPLGGKPPSTVMQSQAPLGQPQPPQPTPQPTQGAKQPIIMYTCPSCKAQIFAPLDQTMVTCTSCGGVFPVDPQASIHYTMQQRQGGA